MRRRPTAPLTAAVACLLGMLAAAPAEAQGGGLGGPITIGGTLVTYGELYGTNRTDPFRPSQTGRIELDPTVSLYGKVNLAFSFLLSSSNGSNFGLGGLPGRQHLNQFGVSPTWSWGRAHLGAFSESYSPLTLDGTRLTGAGFDLHPGFFHVGAFAANSQDAVYGDATSGGFSRTVLGGRIGIGRGSATREGSFLDLIVLRAWDNPKSLPSPTDSSAPTLPTGIGANAFAVTPQSNFVTSLVGRLALLQSRLVWSGELAGAVHSRDRRATPIATSQLSGYPGFLSGVMTPRVGTHGDYAYRTRVSYAIQHLPGWSPSSPRSLTASVGYQRIGAGYVSLGTAWLLNDVSAWDAKTNVRFRRWSAQLGTTLQHDNLDHQKLATTWRRRVVGMFNWQATTLWNTSITASYLGMTNGNADPLVAIAYSNWSLGTTQVFALRRGRFLRNVALTYTFNHAGDANPLRFATGYVTHLAQAQVTVQPSAHLMLRPSLGALVTRFGGAGWSTRMTYGLAGSWRAPGSPWMLSASAATSHAPDANTVVGGLRVQYRLPTADMLTLSVRSQYFGDQLQTTRSFHDVTASLQWMRHF